jgi:hypothetical protein
VPVTKTDQTTDRHSLYNFVFDLSLDKDCKNSTIALRVMGGNRKGTQCSGLKLIHSLPGGCNYRDLALQVGESQMRKYGYGYCATRISD